MISSRSINDLHPKVRGLAQAFESECSSNGIDILIYCTYRDREAQDALYAQGRTTKGNIVTNARGGESMHNYKLAFDFVPMLNGKAMWGDKNLYSKAGIIAEGLGLEWAGRWSGKLKETAHCQYTSGLSLDELKKGKMI
jgi:peptidoglycan L-alanyl-D-glutamate endopeptidase CwlK